MAALDVPCYLCDNHLPLNFIVSYSAIDGYGPLVGQNYSDREDPITGFVRVEGLLDCFSIVIRLSLFHRDLLSLFYKSIYHASSRHFQSNFLCV